MSPTIIPIVIVPLTFLFVLLIILIVKAPKAGACVIGGVLLVAPLFLWRLAAAGALRHGEAIPLFVVPATFLFVLLVILLSKAPKVGAGLIIAIVVMVVLGLFGALTLSHRPVAEVSSIAPVDQWAPSAEERVATIQEADRVFELQMQQQSAAVEVLGTSPAPPTPPTPPAPIWSEGVEQEFEAGIYPSRQAAAKALGRRMVKPIRGVVDDPNATIRVVLFQEGNDRGLVSAIGRAIEDELPGVQCSIEADLRNIHAGEVGLTLRQEGKIQGERRREQSASLTIMEPVEGGRMVGTAFTENKRASAEADYVDKPWVENFSAFASGRPNEAFIVARSSGACTSEGEARRQALDDAVVRLGEALGRRTDRRVAGLAESPITTMDVERGGFVADSFVQSFDGSAGKFWRHAILVDVSGPKLAQLAHQKEREARSTRMSWARMGFSTIGVLVLIGAIYFFLNMATRGYYEWSLRIAGVVLAIVAIVSILMIVQ